MMMKTTDCLILGGGLAGWMAAREAAASGADVILLQDGKGASPWVHGFNVPVHSEDSTAAFLEDTLQSGQGLSDPILAEALCGDAQEIFQELCHMGLAFNREGEGYQTLRPLGASHPRVVSIGNETGAAVMNVLRSQLAGRIAEIPGMRAISLLMDNGRACGAIVYDTRNEKWTSFGARSVVLANGGYCGIYPFSTNKRDSGGDGIAMAYDAGAELCDLEFIQFEPSAAVWPKKLLGTSVITTLFFEGAALRNCKGERFMLRYGPEGERVGKDAMARCIAAEIAAGRGSIHGGVYMDMTEVDPQRLETDYGMYVKRYRNVGIDIAKTWIELAPAPHTSLGGVRIDARGRTAVEGLFACGEISGGLHGANRLGGSAGLEALVFGRRAGRSAAEYAVGRPLADGSARMPIIKGKSIADSLDSLHSDMRTALWNGVSAVRNETGLSEALKVFQKVLDELEQMSGVNAQEVYARLRLRNDCITAMLTAQSALMREESLGCHYRSDASEGKKARYRVVIRKGNNGPEIRKEDLEEDETGFYPKQPLCGLRNTDGCRH